MLSPRHHQVRALGIESCSDPGLEICSTTRTVIVLASDPRDEISGAGLGRAALRRDLVSEFVISYCRSDADKTREPRVVTHYSSSTARDH